MTIVACSSCGYTANSSEDLLTGNVTCKKCGAVIQTGTRQVIPHSKKRKSSHAWKIGVAAGVAVVGVAVIALLMSDGGSAPAKTQLFQLDKQEVDADILAMGISALEKHGWSPDETAFYIETRIDEFKSTNEEVKSAISGVGATNTGLRAKATAADLAGMTSAERREAGEQIIEREDQIKQFETILADYRSGQ